MDDIFKFLLIAGVIIVGLVRTLKKTVSNVEDQRPDNPKQSTDDIPLPEAWGKTLFPKDIFQSTSTESSSSSQKQKSNKKHAKDSDSPINTVQQKIESQRNTSQISSPPILLEEPSENEESFTIHSAEEARRAIIWGEIMQRKY